MKLLIFFILVLGVYSPSTSFSQEKNRVSFQTGLFHSFFDGSQIIDNDFNSSKRKIRNLFGGVLKDSRGVQFTRQVKKNNFISIEYMVLRASYLNSFPLNYNSTPLIYTKTNKILNLEYSKNLKLNNKLSWIYGGGVNYLWGVESFLISNNFGGWGYEAEINGFYRHDFGISIRSGIEYNPVKYLTLYCNLDFIGYLYLETKDSHGVNINGYYKEKYGLKNTPSRTDLSLRFGIGFNF